MTKVPGESRRVDGDRSRVLPERIFEQPGMVADRHLLSREHDGRKDDYSDDCEYERSATHRQPR